MSRAVTIKGPTIGGLLTAAVRLLVLTWAFGAINTTAPFVLALAFWFGTTFEIKTR